LQINQRLLIFLLGDSIPHMREGHEVLRRFLGLPFVLMGIHPNRHEASDSHLHTIDRRRLAGEIVIEQVEFPCRPLRDLGRPRMKEQGIASKPTKAGIVG